MYNVYSNILFSGFHQQSGRAGRSGRGFQCVQQLSSAHSEHGSALELSKSAQHFMMHSLKLNPDQVVELERNTRKKQSIEPLWHDARKVRITASTASKVPQRETTEPG